MAASSESGRAPLDDAEMETWHALIRAHSRVVRKLESELDTEQGLSLPGYEVLSHLSTAPDQRLRMTDLAEHAVLTPSGLTRLVDKLVREGLVERKRCGADARVVYAWLTPIGMARLQRAYPTHLRGVREHFLDWLTETQQRAVADALGGLAGARCREIMAAQDEQVLSAECEAAAADASASLAGPART